jgi:hypothetical protein
MPAFDKLDIKMDFFHWFEETLSIDYFRVKKYNPKTKTNDQYLCKEINGQSHEIWMRAGAICNEYDKNSFLLAKRALDANL